MTFLPHIVDRHAQEAAFLWQLREQQTGAPKATLAVLESFDARVEAHLDGLRIAGDEGRALAWTHLQPDRPETAFPLAWLLFQGPESEELDRFLALLDGEPLALAGAEAALDWISFETLWERIEGWTQAEEPVARLLALRACHQHRRDPWWSMGPGLEDSDERVRRCAVQAAGDLGRLDLLAALQGLEAEDESELALLVARSRILLGDREAAADAGRIALASGQGQAAALAARSLRPTEAQSLVRALGQDPATSHMAVAAAGASGLVALVPWLVERSAQPELARAAGAALSMITGVDLEAEELLSEPPEDLAPGPSDDPADDRVEMDPDAGLPYPNSDGLADWWLREEGRFTEASRYLCGLPAAEAPVMRWLREGLAPLRRRASWERSLCAPGEPLFPWRAPASRQRLWIRSPESALSDMARAS